jgi:hypothetical protein
MERPDMMYLYWNWIDTVGVYAGIPLFLVLLAFVSFWSGVFYENRRLCRLHDLRMAGVLASRNEAWRLLNLDKTPDPVLHYRNDREMDA